MSFNPKCRTCLDAGWLNSDTAVVERCECNPSPDQELFDADASCDHNILPAAGGGVKCTKCDGWFCY